MPQEPQRVHQPPLVPRATVRQASVATARTSSATSWLRGSLQQPLSDHGCSERVDQGREVADVIGHHFALVPQRLNLRLSRRIGDRQRSNFAIRTPQRYGGLIGPAWLHDRGSWTPGPPPFPAPSR